MDQRGNQYLQPLSICNRLYNFITRSLAMQAFKTVTLGCSASQPRHLVAKGQGESAGGEVTPPLEKEEQQTESSNHSASSTSQGHKQGREEASRAGLEEEKADDVSEDRESAAPVTTNTTSLRCLLAAEANPPKKVVSINEGVEEMDHVNRKEKKKEKKVIRKGLDSCEGQGDDEKPLRSILKVGSKNFEMMKSSFA